MLQEARIATGSGQTLTRRWNSAENDRSEGKLSEEEARRASRRTACSVRRHAAVSCEWLLYTRGGGSKRGGGGGRGKFDEGVRKTGDCVHARMTTRETTRIRRHTCDQKHGTATTEPFGTSTSRQAPSSRSPRRRKANARLRSLSFSFLLSYRHTIVPTLSLSPFSDLRPSRLSLLSFLLSLVRSVSSVLLSPPSIRISPRTLNLTVLSYPREWYVRPQVNTGDDFFVPPPRERTAERAPGGCFHEAGTDCFGNCN